MHADWTVARELIVYHADWPVSRAPIVMPTGQPLSADYHVDRPVAGEPTMPHPTN